MRQDPDGMALDLDRYVPALLTFIANKLAHGANAEYRRRFGISVTEWRILSMLAVEPGIPAARICQVIGFDKGPVSRSLTQMERRGLVTVGADPGDARRRLVRLSAAGREAHDRTLEVALERERRLLACLSPQERETLIGLLGRLHDNLGAVAAPSTDRLVAQRHAILPARASAARR